jgi:hypothetical protein
LLATKSDGRGEALYFWPLGAAFERLSKDYGIIQVPVTLQEIGSV